MWRGAGRKIGREERQAYAANANARAARSGEKCVAHVAIKRPNAAVPANPEDPRLPIELKPEF